MLLIGMFDSPYVRRLAVSMEVLGLSFQHHNWSVGADFDKIRAYNPVGRVPTLVLDDGEVLMESSAILDFIDELAGPERALLPRAGAPRRGALRLMAVACGGADKAVAQLYEVAFRPAQRRHPDWLARCRVQSNAALQYLEDVARKTPANSWLVGETMSHADITVACASTFIHKSLDIDRASYPSLLARVAKMEALPEFQKYHLPFFAPQPDSAAP